jgi:peptide/nickel transport system substrate-binding protein
MRARAAILAFALTALAGCGSHTLSATKGAGHGLLTRTPPATSSVRSVVWAVYRPVNGLDPIFAFDYPENTVISVLCDSLLRQQPDGAITPGLATLTHKTPRQIVLHVRAGVHFWDGSPLTAADVVFSLDRQRDPSLGGLYTQVFDRVRSIRATGPLEVTIDLTKPDYWLEGELSSMSGVVIEKRYALAHAKTYGTPSGGAMCTGPYKLQSWTGGGAVTVVRNPHYWDRSLPIRADKIVFQGVSDAAALTSGLLTGAIDRTYLDDTSTLPELERASNLRVYLGPSYDTDLFIVTNLKGVLGDPRVRRALSLAFNRRSYISSVYAGAAQLPRLPTNPGAWGYAREVFRRAWNSMPEPKVNLARARQLIKEAGATGKPLVIGTSTGIAQTSEEADAWQTAANSIGLHAKLYNVSPQNYINFFTSASARRPIDAIATTTYGDYADPAALEKTYLLAGGDQNYDHYSNPTITRLLDAARSQSSPVRRAKDMVAADKLVMKVLPWIPIADVDTILVMNKRLTGPAATFSYMYAPWLAMVGRGR